MFDPQRTVTDRGFVIVTFADANGDRCSLQQSSAILAGTEGAHERPGSSGLWLGLVEPRSPKLASPRMHLDRERVEWLVEQLRTWLATGDLV